MSLKYWTNCSKKLWTDNRQTSTNAAKFFLLNFCFTLAVLLHDVNTLFVSCTTELLGKWNTLLPSLFTPGRGVSGLFGHARNPSTSGEPIASWEIQYFSTYAAATGRNVMTTPFRLDILRDAKCGLLMLGQLARAWFAIFYKRSSSHWRRFCHTHIHNWARAVAPVLLYHALV